MSGRASTVVPGSQAPRRDLETILRAALDAVRPAPLVERAVRATPALAGAVRVHGLALGKAAAGMAQGAAGALGDALVGGLAVSTDAPDAAPRGWRILTAGHPEPTEASVRAAAAVHEFAAAVPPGHVLLVLLSGGASALLAAPPPGLTVGDLRATTRALLAAGAPIAELNVVRKHLDALKGGGLALAAGRAQVVALAISDVPGDALDVIASGPVSPDATTFADALAVLRARGVRDVVPQGVWWHLERGARGELPETPKPGDARLDHVAARVIAGNATALDAAGAAAARLGYRVERWAEPVTGEARVAGERIGRAAAAAAGGAPVCLLAGGETTVTVRGPGRGGRNQEVTLGAAGPIAGTAAVVASVGTDGIDGPTPAAGAVADGTTLARARAAGLDPGRHLDRNDSHAFFAALGDLIVTGPTGTNVMDVCVALVAARGTAG